MLWPVKESEHASQFIFQKSLRSRKVNSESASARYKNEFSGYYFYFFRLFTKKHYCIAEIPHTGFAAAARQALCAPAWKFAKYHIRFTVEAKSQNIIIWKWHLLFAFFFPIIIIWVLTWRIHIYQTEKHSGVLWEKCSLFQLSQRSIQMIFSLFIMYQQDKQGLSAVWKAIPNKNHTGFPSEFQSLFNAGGRICTLSSSLFIFTFNE